ncbi:MAG: hypothetical protein DMF69_18465 [Acidobacteria bacterium]|nr:MAG: hypothetical protein DMF69_18465 [Acidobacteriota bacterium]
MPSKTKKQGDRVKRLPVSLSGQITLLSDFGNQDYFVGAVKGVIASINPAASLIDITHEIPAQDIDAAAFTILASYRSFAPGTIHVGVVDPGVGTARKPILAFAGGHFFVGPDNGIFSYILEKETDHRVFHVTAQKYFCQPLSNTFHGRDVFAPVAAHLSNGLSPESFGEEIFDTVRLPPLVPTAPKPGEIKGRILHIDHFGNCVTNIDRSVLERSNEDRAKVMIKGKKIESFRESYAERKGKKSLFAIWGSAGFLEISACNRSAAKILKARRGDSVTIEFV